MKKFLPSLFKLRNVAVVALIVVSTTTITSLPGVSPALAVAPVTAVKATAGYTHGCAVMSDGSVRCWGANGSGQLGDGTTVGSKATVVSGIANAIDVGVNPGNYESTHRSCALLATGFIKCWGVNYMSSRSSLGTGDTVGSYKVPVPVCRTGSYAANTCVPLANVVQMSIDAHGGCGLVSTDASITSDNRVYCWGQTSTTAITNNAVPVCTSGSAGTCVEFSGAVKIDSNQYHRCARTDDSKAYCWGQNINAQLGREISSNLFADWAATAVSSGGVAISDVIDIATGMGNTCIIRSPIAPSSINRIQCVGQRYYGHLGNGMLAETGFVSNWTDICGFSRSLPDSAQPCASTTLPGSATQLRGGSNVMCAYIADGYGTNDAGWSCWSATGAEYLARPSFGSTTGYGYIGQLCTAAGVYSVTGQCASGNRFAAAEVDLTGSTACGVVSGAVYCWGMGHGGSILNKTSWVTYPFLIVLGKSLRYVTAPDGAFPGVDLSQQPTIQLVNETGVDVQTADITVTASLEIISGTATLGGTLTSNTNAQGRADFTNLQISAVGNYLLKFSTTSYGNLGTSFVVVVDTTVPTLTSGALNTNGTTLVLTFSESLHATAAAASAFTVTASAVLLTPTSAVVSGSTVVLTLSPALGPLAVITVAYVAPASNSATSNAAVQDLAGNDAASFSGRSVTNNSTADIIAPTASWTEPTTPSSSRTLSYTLTFSEAVSGIVAGDFASIGTATGCVITTASSAANLSVVITVTCSSDGTLTLRLRSGSVLDAASNTGPTSDALATAVTITSPAVTTTVASTTTVQPTGTTTTVTTVPVTATTVAMGQSSISTVTTVVGNTNTSSTTVTTPRGIKAAGNADVATTSTAPVATTTTLAKLPVIDVPRTEVGGSSVLIGGKVVEGVITRENNRLIITAGPMVVRIWAVAADGSKLSLDADGRLRVKAGDSVTVDATGFSSKTRVEVRLYSDPVLLGRTDVDDKGVMSASYEVPEGIPSGNHNVVLAGERDGNSVTMALSVVLGEQTNSQAFTAVLVGVLIAAGITALMLPAFLRRRKKEVLESESEEK
jgi:hypothetical protein